MKLELLPLDAKHEPIKVHAKTNNIVPDKRWAELTVKLASRRLSQLTEEKQS